MLTSTECNIIAAALHLHTADLPVAEEILKTRQAG